MLLDIRRVALGGTSKPAKIRPWWMDVPDSSAAVLYRNKNCVDLF